MSHYKVNPKDIFFILKEQIGYGKLCEFERYSELDEATLDMVVNQAMKFALTEISPLQEIGEKWGVVYENGQVKCAPEFKKSFEVCAENGWVAPSKDPEYGGQGFPRMMSVVINDFFYGACQALNMATTLTHGAGHLIESFGTEELKQLYLAKMYSGKWAGTMALTEAGAGSNLAALKTTAYREGDHFKIKGNKIFISWGDHDLTENIIHLVLARIEGAPEGVRGISLFVIPKIRVLPDGSLGEPNDVLCGGVEKKLGLHASPTCQLLFGDNDGCIGYLCGQENKGLAHMFQMMNEARIGTGISGMTLASTAYQNALQYTTERIQGAALDRKKPGSVPIIDHPDVRRMLLWMKAMVDGMRSILYTCAYWVELSEQLADGKEKVHYQNLVEFITPIANAYCSDMGFRVCETAIQCLGGYGYCCDYPLEQYLRDSKIMSLYEGTNGIQSMDLMGRKMTIDGGAPVSAFKREIEQFCLQNREHSALGDRVQALSGVATRLWEAAGELTNKMATDPLQWASYTYPALLAFSELTMVWRLLDMAIIAHGPSQKQGEENDFYRGKVLQATYFADMTLPHTLATVESCLRHGREVLEMTEKAF